METVRLSKIKKWPRGWSNVRAADNTAYCKDHNCIHAKGHPCPHCKKENSINHKRR